MWQISATVVVTKSSLPLPLILSSRGPLCSMFLSHSVRMSFSVTGREFEILIHLSWSLLRYVL